MSLSKKDQDGVRLLRRNRSSVGPGMMERCLSRNIASCQCDVLQPQPECSSTAQLGQSKTLLPTLTPRTLCLWKDEDVDEYHLTVIKEDKDEVREQDRCGIYYI